MKLYTLRVTLVVLVQAETAEEAKAKLADGDVHKVYYNTAQGVGVLDWYDVEDDEYDLGRVDPIYP